jgi:hypothetical protein
MKLPEARRKVPEARIKFPENGSDDFRQRDRKKKSWVRNPLCLAAFLFGAISLAAAQQPAQSSAAPSPAAQPPAAQAPAARAATPDSAKPAPPQTPQQKQLAEDTAKLLVLANQLKAELDKSNMDTLSLGVIRKAEQVEKLAHKVRDEMKGQTGQSQN